MRRSGSGARDAGRKVRSTRSRSRANSARSAPGSEPAGASAAPGRVRAPKGRSSPISAARSPFRKLSGIDRAIIGCEKCPRLRAHCTRISVERKRAFRDQEYWGRPVPGYGDPRARVLVVGLAPAAHGGNRTGRIFTGDSSGNWLYGALHRFGFANQPDSTGRGDGLRLTDVYVTAAGRCAPPDNKPTRQELDNCGPYLEAEIRLLTRVRIVVLLGTIGRERWLRASGWWSKLPPRERPPFGHGRESRLPDGTIVICSYHPSRQNTNTGRLTIEAWHAIFRRVRALVDALDRRA
jgi:uracil-DNA glycosylase family 4